VHRRRRWDEGQSTNLRFTLADSATLPRRWEALRTGIRHRAPRTIRPETRPGRGGGDGRRRQRRQSAAFELLEALEHFLALAFELGVALREVAGALLDRLQLRIGLATPRVARIDLRTRSEDVRRLRLRGLRVVTLRAGQRDRQQRAGHDRAGDAGEQ